MSKSGRATVPTSPSCACCAAIVPGGRAIAAGGSRRRSTESCSSSNSASTAPTPRPRAPLKSWGPPCPRFKSMITNRNSTMMAPAYTRTCSTAKNWASSSTNSPASWNSVTTSHSALATGLRRVTHIAADTIATPAKTQKTTTVRCPVNQAIDSLALGVGGVPQGRDRVGLGAEAFQIVHEAIARILGVLVVHAHVDGLFGADLLAVAAEDAAELVDLVNQRIPVALLILAGDQLDAVGGADLRAQAARHALGPALLVGKHAVRAAPATGNRPVRRAPLLGVLHRHLRPEQVLQREHHALERRPEVGGLLRGPLQDLHPDGHQAALRATEPETTRPRSRPHTAATSNTRFTAPSVRAIGRS